jgi:hypothetical protein
VLSVTSGGLTDSVVMAEYRKGITIRIPVLSTDRFSRIDSSYSKLTYDSVKEIVSLAREIDCLCHNNQKKS